MIRQRESGCSVLAQSPSPDTEEVVGIWLPDWGSLDYTRRARQASSAGNGSITLFTANDEHGADANVKACLPELSEHARTRATLCHIGRCRASKQVPDAKQWTRIRQILGISEDGSCGY